MEESFVIEDFEPAYRRLAREGTLKTRVAEAIAALAACRACPRACEVDRLANETKVCKTGRHARVSSAFPHFGEEDVLRGSRGSGTIFFSFCNLSCVFCQNWDISQQPSGKEMTADEIAACMLDLQQQGCHNINFVTPEHVVPQMIEAVGLAVEGGLRIPIVYNTSAYDAMGSLALLDGIVDIYIPDFKLWEKESARRLLKAKDYPEMATAALKEMHRQVGALKLGRDGVARRGVLVRHLVMPGKGDETKATFEFLANEVSKDTFVNIMGQYRPANQVGEPDASGVAQYSEIGRRPTQAEIAQAYDHAREAGLWRFDERAPSAMIRRMLTLLE